MATTISTKSKGGNIHFRVSLEAKKVIDKATVVSGQSLTEFATRSILDAANSVLEREYTTVLSDRDRDSLLAMLDADSQPNEGLREAAEIHGRSISENV